MGCRVVRRAVLAAGLAAGALALPGPLPGAVEAQGPSLDCDAPFPTGGRGTVATRHDCWLSESGGQAAVPWPGPGSFAEGSVVTVYSLRWDSGGGLRLYCSAESSRGADYDRWFVAAAVRGGTELEQASYGVRGASVPGGDRVVSSFVGGRGGRVQWERGSRYDARARRWVSEPWRRDRSAPAPAEPAFIRSPDPAERESAGDGAGFAGPPLHAGYTCPESGLMPRRLGDRVDDAPRGAEDPYRCLEAPAGAGEIFSGDAFNVQAQYLPGRGRFGDGDEDDDDGDPPAGGPGRVEDGNGGQGGGRGPGNRQAPGNPQGGSHGPGNPQGGNRGPGGSSGEQGGGVPGLNCGGGENNAVCDDPDDGDEEDDGDEGDNRETETPKEGEGRVVPPTGADPGGALGSGRRLAEAPVVAAFSSGMTCVERESLVLVRRERRTWVDTSYTEYDPACDLGGVVLPPGWPEPPGLRPRYCRADGFDLSGRRSVPQGYWDTWWEHLWEANAAETDAHLPWARVFWHDGGGRAGFESGGVIVGDDGTAACLLARGFVRNPGLPGVVPAAASRLAGAWTDYTGGAVSVRCPKEDGSTGFTSAPAGSSPPAFDALVSLDFGPAIHGQAAGEGYTLEEYRAARPCGDWPADAAEPPVPGVDCGVPLGVSPARRARLGAFERSVRTSAGTGRITRFRVDGAAAMMAHSWDVRQASGLAGRLELDTPWDGGTDVGGGTAGEARAFGPPVSPWADCGRRDYLMGTGTDSLWGAWVARAGARRGGEVAGAAALLALAGGLDPRATVSCTPGGECRAAPGAFDAHHRAIEEEARRLHDARAADPERVCGIGDRVSPPGP